MERCTAAEHKSATDGEPMEATRGDALLKRKAQEEIPSATELSIDEILLPGRADVVSVAAAAVEVTEPIVVDLAKAAVSEPQAEGGIQEAVSEPQDGYEDGAEYDDDEGEDDYDDCGSDYQEEEEYDYGPLFEEERPKVRAVLLHFPETADLSPHELDAAVERVLEQSKPEYEHVAAPGKIRLLTADIERALDPWRAPPPSIIHDKDTLPADLALKMEELDREFLPLYEEAEDELEQFRAKVRRELVEKGYVEVDEDYYDKKDEFERQMMRQIQEEWDQKIDVSRFPVANNEEGICYYSEEHGGYI